jgi:glycolate oxidase
VEILTLPPSLDSGPAAAPANAVRSKPVPTPDARLVETLRDIVGDRGIVRGKTSLKVYECDGYTLERSAPDLVVLPETTEEAVRVVRALAAAGMPFVPRGAGTGVSGGCLPVGARVMIGTARMRRIRRIDVDDRTAEVEAGVVNLEVTRVVEAHGLYYAPDPSSQSACTIGGNVAENSGGPHTLKYGVTVNHLLALEVVLPDGRVLWLERDADQPGYDLVGLFTGSEGTLGLVTAARVRLLRKPEAVATLLGVFPGVPEASRAVSAIIAAGIIPAALEMMDALVIEAVEAAYKFGFPAGAGAVLLIELDGMEAGLAALTARVEECCRREGASEIRRATSEAERALLWKSRKRAFGAMGRLTPSYCTQDGVVPRSRLPEIVARIAEVSARYNLRIANLMHAGDGNIHPLVLYDESKPGEVERVLAAGDEILRACLELGGSITGEHGIGVEKLGLLSAAFTEDTLTAMTELRRAFDPRSLCNPDKMLPTPGSCVEVTRPRPRGGG